eukprot:TRINITY_DN36613_c0_g1_i1.p1 TRINITY_DN36613_c0_g1~~TRINITY_DN36613_c0_g1_i1.p1  ORF type:complete len:118 (-),score=36.73 TRINITY_DN36613_c0_g1_i1:90-443(-)
MFQLLLVLCLVYPGYQWVLMPEIENCNYHPCGWITYRDGDWNNYDVQHVTTNTFCSCLPTQRCRYSFTKTALDLHLFTCQAMDSPNTIFPGTIIMRRRSVLEMFLTQQSGNTRHMTR